MDYTFGWFSRAVTYAGTTYFTIRAFGVDDGGKIAFFARQRCFIQLAVQNSCTATIANEEYSLDYTLDPGTYDIDVTDLVSELDTGESIYINAMAMEVALVVLVSDATDPLSMAMPLSGEGHTGISTFLQLPPRKLYTMAGVALSTADDWQQNFEIVKRSGGCYFDPDGVEETAELITANAGKYSMMTGSYELTTSSKPTIFYLKGSAGKAIYIKAWAGQVLELPCGVEGRILYWTSRFWNTKKATWLLRNLTTGVADSVTISTGSAMLATAKKSVQSGEFYLPDLCAADVFYYSDILTSPQVWFINANGDKQYITIDTNSVTLPNANSVAELAFTAEICKTTNWAL